jgi:D-hexose-6-phosphate mutarotase
MEIELWNGSTKAIVDPRGAWLTNLSDESGDVLFPKRLLKNADGEIKQRGGCHVCLPNFGPGGDSGLPQHGFGRDMVWEISDKTESSVLFELPRGRDGYEALSAELSYQLGERGLVMTLDLKNKDDKAKLRVAPAFYPYFAVLGDGKVKINGDVQLLDELHETVFTSGESQSLETPSRMLTLTSEQLPTWAHWTDQLGAYICVEPTAGGYAFLKGAANDEILQPGEMKAYALKIEWHEKSA